MLLILFQASDTADRPGAQHCEIDAQVAEGEEHKNKTGLL